MERNYRRLVKTDELINFTVQEKETDLLISAERDLKDMACKIVSENRRVLEDYIKFNPEFSLSLEPYREDSNAPKLIQEMAEVTRPLGIGPMAAVAGCLSQRVGEFLFSFSSQVLIENGGDIFLKTKKKRKIGIYAGPGFLGEKLALEIHPEDSPLGVCTSSGTFGHSLSFGKADAVVVLSANAALADAAATAIGNRVKGAQAVSSSINWGKMIPGILGILVIIERKIAVWGRINLVKW